MLSPMPNKGGNIKRAASHSLRAAFRGFLTLLFPAVAFSQEVPPAPNIRINVDRVSVGVVVTDLHGQFVQGLQSGDFHLFDDGVEQPITDFLSVDEPAQVLLLVEAGPAVYMVQSGHLQAVQVLLDGLAPADRVAIARYDQNAEPLLNFIPDKRVAAGALDQLRFNLGFGQLNLASSLDTALDWLAGVPGKKSLVLLSTGVDTSPPDSLQKLLARLPSTDVRILPVSLSGPASAPATPAKKAPKKNQPPDPKVQLTSDGLAAAAQELTAIAEANGSRAYFPKTSQDFTQVFAEVSQLIRHEYSLGFRPPARDGRVHAITISLTAPTCAVPTSDTSPACRCDHRRAYVAPLPDEAK